MSFWQQILSATGMGRALPWVVVIFLVAAFVLLFSTPEERLRIRTALVLFALSIVAFVIAAAIVSYGVPQTSLAFKWTRWAARLFQWFALINIAAVFVFELLLEPL